jgi:predicted DNA-binding transcriptional regulator AlpA
MIQGMTRDEADPVGVTEIAERLAVKHNTVQHWRIRHDSFPGPRWTVGGRPAWNWADIAAWHAERVQTKR